MIPSESLALRAALALSLRQPQCFVRVVKPRHLRLILLLGKDVSPLAAFLRSVTPEDVKKRKRQKASWVGAVLAP